MASEKCTPRVTTRSTSLQSTTESLFSTLGFKSISIRRFPPVPRVLMAWHSSNIDQPHPQEAMYPSFGNTFFSQRALRTQPAWQFEPCARRLRTLAGCLVSNCHCAVPYSLSARALLIARNWIAIANWSFPEHSQDGRRRRKGCQASAEDSRPGGGG